MRRPTDFPRIEPAHVLAGVFLAGLGICGPVRAECRNRPPAAVLPPGLKLTIRAEKPVAETSGRPVIILVELSNESKTTLSVRDSLLPERDDELHVRDASGKEPSFTDLGRHLRTLPQHGSGTDIKLAPGEKITEQEDLAQVYDISMPGSYTVEACREIYVWGNIYSNKVVIPFVAPPVVDRSEK